VRKEGDWAAGDTVFNSMCFKRGEGQRARVLALGSKRKQSY
jgi:hypothetical protein